MALEMKSSCERCQARLDVQGKAYICRFECTFCQECARALNDTCPNCGGELVRRPKPKSAAAQAPNNSLESESISARRSVAS